MKLYIEVIFMCLAILMFIVYYIWYIISMKRALKNYIINDDKSRKPEGGLNIGTIEGTKLTVAEPDKDSIRPEEPRRSRVLQDANISDAGKNSNRVGKFKSFFKRRRRTWRT